MLEKAHGIKAEQFLGNYDYHNYNQNNRSWSITKYNYNIIDNIFNGYLLSKDKRYQSIFPIKQEVQRNNLFYNFPNFNQRKMYKYLRQLQLTTNSIKFMVLGNITRDAGQYVKLKCTDQQQLPLYEGLWHIYGCRHTWTGRIYHNELLCYRTFKYKPLWNKNNNGSVY